MRIVSGGTDTHIVLLDLSAIGITGKQAEDRLDATNITSNKNPVPFDVMNPAKWSGLRLGTAAATTRGFREAEFRRLGGAIAGLLTGAGSPDQARATVADLCAAFPVYGGAA